MARILIADHLAERRNILSTFLRSDEHAIIPVARESEAVKMMRETHPDLIILEGTVGGTRILNEAKGLDSEPAIIMLMANAPSTEQFVELMNQGVNEVLISPLDIIDVQTKTQRALSRRPVSNSLQLRFPDLVGSSEKMQQVYRKLIKAAAADHPVFLSGETGSGKQLVARQLHQLSSRKEREFRSARCMGLTEAELESELFGHESGVFPWAVERRPGEIELGDGGTLYLEEVGKLTPLIQMKLLGFLENQKLHRMGSAHSLSADVRVVAGTSELLFRRIEEGTFRADLFYRLTVCQIEIPPLRARISDIPELVYYFLSPFEVQIAPEAMEVLMNYPWPGSVEELKNAVEQAVNACENNRIELRDLPQRVLKVVAAGARQYKFSPPSKT
jgi:two-component system, NtrC family, response regulator AtoC